ncbi:MAG TPA: FAD-dependent oxidoreductase [Patescibacteria group bacterium]
MQTQPIVIIGGGFAGLRTALDLDRLLGHRLDCPIFLIDPSPVHVYTPGLFDLMHPASPRVSVIPFRDILAGTHIHHIQERVVRIDVERKQVQTEHRRFSYADLVLTPGSDTVPLPQKGAGQSSLSAHNFEHLIRLREQIQANFSRDKERHLHVLIAGGGLSGVELALGLQSYIESQAARQGASSRGCHITLAEESSRILPMFKPAVSHVVARWLKQHKISIVTKTKLTPSGARRLETESEDGPIKTVVWAHGRQPSLLAAKTKGLRHDAKGRVLVNAHLEALDEPGVWVGGDSAAVDDSGWKASAIAHGNHIARAITSKRTGRTVSPYLAHTPTAIIQFSPDYAMLVKGSRLSAGISIAWLKQWDDLKYYLSILPIPLAFARWAKRGEQLGGEDSLWKVTQSPL